MSVIIKINGENDLSDEYLSAEKLKKIIEKTLDSRVLGEIVLFPSATLYGQTVKDIDIMMIGYLNNYSPVLKYCDDNGITESEVSVKSFCTTIEIKSHSINGICREGTDFKVKYGDRLHNVTKQSNMQKQSARNFFEDSLGASAFITNLIWFTEVTKEELNNLLSYQGNIITSNVLPNTFDFKDLIQLLVMQKKLQNRNGSVIFDSGVFYGSVDSYVKPLRFFSKVKEGMGELTRHKIEQITASNLNNADFIEPNDKLTMIRGRAGTGKTIDLINYAIKLVEEKGARVQILTYNRALVSDIRRLFALAELPDMFEVNCVCVNTMQSYFFRLINECLYDGKLNGEKYIERYSEILDEFIDFIKSDKESLDIIKSITNDIPQLCWDYIFIDEAQDWSAKERDLILLLYDKDKIFVADGGEQFVRRIRPCDWTVVRNRENIKLKYCLRQKNNLIKFINAFSNEVNNRANRIIGTENMVGGKIIIIRDKEKFYSVIKTELKNLKKFGNIKYDMLFCVPPYMVEQEPQRHFKFKREFEKNNVAIWDGTNEDNRSNYSISPDECRLVQYDSARGLEGWTVCCVDFDEFIDLKDQQYEMNANKGNMLFLESEEEMKKKYILNWALIPFTRAIDTLIIVLKDEMSETSKLILDLGEKYKDFIEIV